MSEREPKQKDSRLKPTSAVLDEMHRGDIHGAFGTIRLSDVAPRRTWRRRLLTLLAIVGPGLIVMVGDNDAGGVSTYAQAGQDFGYSLLWTLLLLIPVLIVNQEMVVRLGGLTSNSALLIVAVVGTTVAPWQLFFQQSNVIDKRITPRWLDYEKADTVIGAFVVVIGAAAIMMATASAFSGTSEFGHYQDGLRVAQGLHRYISPAAGAIFALLLFDASIVGASAVTLATSYAFGDMFGLRHSLHRGIREAKLFYASYTAMVVVAAAIVLIPGAPLGLITTAVQALAGIMLPSATVFAVLRCNDRAALGPWVNRPWLNAVAGAIVGALLVLSLILVISTVIPSVDVTTLLVVLSVVAAMVLLAGGTWSWLTSRGRAAVPEVSREERESWRMTALAVLDRPVWPMGSKLAIYALSGYLVLSIIMLVVKAVGLAML